MLVIFLTSVGTLKKWQIIGFFWPKILFVLAANVVSVWSWNVKIDLLNIRHKSKVRKTFKRRPASFIYLYTFSLHPVARWVWSIFQMSLTETKQAVSCIAIPSSDTQNHFKIVSLKIGSSVQNVRKTFRGTIISYPLVRTPAHASFGENFAYARNGKPHGYLLINKN